MHHHHQEGSNSVISPESSSSTHKHDALGDSATSVIVSDSRKAHKRHVIEVETGSDDDDEESGTTTTPRRMALLNGDVIDVVTTTLESKEHTNNASSSWYDGRLFLVGTIAAWYCIGVCAIVTTKLLLKQYHVPPLVLTTQQLFVGSLLLRLVCIFRNNGSMQPWPWNKGNHYEQEDTSSAEQQQVKKTGGLLQKWRLRQHVNFLLVGVFHSLDFLCSNTAFSQSAASFVETIKASDPITTTAIALLWKVDRLMGYQEASSLFLLIAGVLMSTIGNSMQTTTTTQETPRLLQEQQQQSAPDTALKNSILTACTVMAANLCFGFRAMNQKKFRTNEKQQPMDDINLLCRMLQVGATFLSLPLLVFYSGSLLETISEQPTEVKLTYLKLAAVNSISYVTYK